MEAENRLRLADVFTSITDPRQAGTVEHDLVDLRVVAVTAVLVGAGTFVEIELWAKEKLAWLRRYVRLAHGVPSHDTFGRLFGLIDPTQHWKGIRLSGARSLSELLKKTNSPKKRGVRQRFEYPRVRPVAGFRFKQYLLPRKVDYANRRYRSCKASTCPNSASSELPLSMMSSAMASRSSRVAWADIIASTSLADR